jgi:chromosome segregation ATPase
VPDAVLSWLLSDPEAGTYRFVVRAVASGAAGELRSAREQLHETEESLREHAAALAEARDRIAELEERGRDSEELSERVASLEKELADLSGDEAALRQLLLDKHDATVRQQDEMHATSARREAQAAAEIAGLRGELTAAHARIEWMQTRRIWRVGTRWWRLKDFLKA